MRATVFVLLATLIVSAPATSVEAQVINYQGSASVRGAWVDFGYFSFDPFASMLPYECLLTPECIAVLDALNDTFPIGAEVTFGAEVNTAASGCTYFDGGVLYPTAATSFRFSAGSYVATATAGLVNIQNDTPNGDYFEILARSTAIGSGPTCLYTGSTLTAPTLGGVPLAQFGLGLHSRSGALVNSTSIPTVAPSVASDFPQFNIQFGQYGGGGGVAVSIMATPTSFSVVGATPIGTAVEVPARATLPNGAVADVSLKFDDVVTGGTTAVTTSSTGPPPPSGFKLTNPPVFYEITTTATFTGNVRVCLSWTDGQIANENRVSIFHYENNQWVDITDPTSRDTVNNKVCGTASSLSPFTLFETLTYPFTGFFAPVESAPTVNAVKAGAAVPVKFSLGGDLGLNIFTTGFPRTQLMPCDASAVIDEVTETVTAGGSSLSYDALTDRYTYVWKTDKAWGGSCRELQLQLTDGEIYRARFTFRK